MEMTKQMGMPPPALSEPPEPKEQGNNGAKVHAWFGETKTLAVLALFIFLLLLTVLSGAHRRLSLDQVFSRPAEVSQGAGSLLHHTSSFSFHSQRGVDVLRKPTVPADLVDPVSRETRDKTPSSDAVYTVGTPRLPRLSNTSCTANSSSGEPPVDKSLGGLLSSAFDEASCRSRFEAARLWKPSNRTPSPYLLQKLRSYEALHKKCGPNTELYNKSTEQLLSNRIMGPMECNYVVWMPSDGLGNRMISIASAFLYALLNDKVLLLFLSEDMKGLFCEPFPDTTWALPSDFPIKNIRWIWSFDKDPNRFGSMMKKKLLSNRMSIANGSFSLPPYLYLHLIHDNDDYDKMFYCEEAQLLLQHFPWILLRSNQYFVPSLFLVPKFEEELRLLFNERTAVFHLLGRYLFHPSNSVWGYITRYYEAYLANAKERLGMQIRIFGDVDFNSHSSYIIGCALTRKLLPGLDTKGSALPNITGAKPKAVLVTSLSNGYFERLRDMYYEHATVTGEVIGVYQPSHEERQHTEKLNHNMKALAEIYLLSFSDSLVTSPFSTFGYVAQGLGGTRPWMLVKHDKDNLCLQSLTMEPCFHFPPSFECKSRRKMNLGSVVPYLRHCEDFPRGIKLFN
ncbi:hypothetical protein ZIOFF_067235 [Zingiber officinale]|uniref:Fucosyltransferase n=1 Tax=Zingiber officinale TaxID=94328 RepID=A0A8J5C5J1_ZINOF|nr:hypothetical protein ZIOFF_067235 [Zingiber officinale]